MVTPIPAAGPPIASYIKAHDAFFRHVFAQPGAQRDLLLFTSSELNLSADRPEPDPPVDLDRAEVEPVDKAFANGKNADLVLQLSGTPPTTTPSAVFVFEHKSYRDPHAALQLLGYCVALASRERRRMWRIYPIIFYHGARAWKRIAPPPIAGLTFDPAVLDLRSFAVGGSDTAARAAIGPRTTAALLVMARVRHVLTEQDVREVLAHLATAAIDTQFRRELLWYFTYHTPRVNRELILKLAAEPQYNAIGGDAMTMRESYVLEGKLEGKREGILEGRIEGKQEGMVEARREIALNALGQGFEVETIARLTGLDPASIERLAAEEAIEEGGNGSH